MKEECDAPWQPAHRVHKRFSGSRFKVRAGVSDKAVVVSNFIPSRNNNVPQNPSFLPRSLSCHVPRGAQQIRDGSPLRVTAFDHVPYNVSESETSPLMFTPSLG